MLSVRTITENKHPFELNEEEALKMDLEAEEKLRALASEEKVKRKDKLQYNVDRDNNESETLIVNTRTLPVKKIENIDLSDDVDLISLSRFNYNRFLQRYDTTFE